MASTSRRTFLTTMGVAAVGFAQLFANSRIAAQQGVNEVRALLNLAATAETIACAYYYAALTRGGLRFNPAQTLALRAALDAEVQHLSYINVNGGAALASEFFMPTSVFSDITVFVNTTEQFEWTLSGAYLAATRQYAARGNALLAMTMAQIASVEAQHIALARDLGGFVPNSVTFLKAPYLIVPEAEPTLRSYIDGGAGFEERAVFPGIVAAGGLASGSGIEPSLPATDVGAF